MLIQSEYYFHTTKPTEYMIVDDGIRINSNIHSTYTPSFGEVWYASSILIPIEDDAYLPYKRIIELQNICDEQDELIAELMEK